MSQNLIRACFFLLSKPPNLIEMNMMFVSLEVMLINHKKPLNSLYIETNCILKKLMESFSGFAVVLRPS